MRSQVIDMIGYAGDISTAKDRIGIDSALIMIKGGTSGTAIKVVTCSTSDGEFVDYVTLEAEGASDLVKGYYVNLKGADKYIKVTTAKFADFVFGDYNVTLKRIFCRGKLYLKLIPQGCLTIRFREWISRQDRLSIAFPP